MGAASLLLSLAAAIAVLDSTDARAMTVAARTATSTSEALPTLKNSDPKCAPGYAIAAVSLSDYEANEKTGKSTAMVNIDYTANLPSVINRPMQACLGPKVRDPAKLNQFSCTATTAGVTAVPVTAETALLNALGEVYAWAALTGCDRGTSRSKDPLILVVPEKYPAFRYIGPIPNIYGQCVSKTGASGVEFAACGTADNLRLFPDGGLRDADGLCFVPASSPPYQECITTTGGTLYQAQKWVYISDTNKLQLKAVAPNQCLVPQKNGGLKLASCSGPGSQSYFQKLPQLVTGTSG